MDSSLFAFLGAFTSLLVFAEVAGSLWTVFWEYLSD